MRIVMLSDSHGLHDHVKVPFGHILIHAGDCTDDAGRASLRNFLVWFERHPHPKKVLVAGNHDWAFEKWPDLARAMIAEVAPSVTYLQDSGINIAGLSMWGSPVSPRFCDWAFNRDRGADIRKHWDLIPNGIEVLVTHGPPKGYCDWTPFDREHVGCADLLEAIKRVRPKLHCFGHVHHGRGHKELLHDDGFKTTIVNCTICDEAYNPIHQPWVFEL